MQAKTFIIDSPSLYTFNIFLWVSCLFTYKPKYKQKTGRNFSHKSYLNDIFHIFSCILKVAPNMIANIMKCPKSSIRDLHWLYLVRTTHCHFCNALAPECDDHHRKKSKPHVYTHRPKKIFMIFRKETKPNWCKFLQSIKL